MKTFSFCLLSLLIMTHYSFAMASDFELAKKYIASYSEFDLEKMSDFYSEDAEFKDLN